MSDQYNLVADQYDLSFQLVPYRLHVEAYTTFKVLGDVKDCEVIELATGTGFYARALRRAGAKRVVAIDIAEQMVDIARSAEQAEPLGIEYHVQDVMQFQGNGSFDIALAVYLLHYAPTKEALLAMAQAVASHLKSGGRFVTYQLSPDLARDQDYYSDLGMKLSVQPAGIDGETVPFTVKLGDIAMPEVTAYRWNKETVDSALAAAGFTNIRWIQPELSAAGAEQFGADSFAKYLANPHALLIECTKK